MNKADSDLTFMNKNNQSQHMATQFQKMSLFEKLQDSSRGLTELRAMGPDTALKMSSLNTASAAAAAKNLQQKIITQTTALTSNNNNNHKNQSNYSANTSLYTPNILWDVMKTTSNANNSSTKAKNDFDFESLNHQTGVQQQFQQQLDNQSASSFINDLNDSNKKLLKSKLNDKSADLSGEPFSLFAPASKSVTTATNVTSSVSTTSASVSPPLASANSLRAHLIAQNLNPALVDDVLNKYKGETDIEKLIFLARGISFSSDF